MKDSYIVEGAFPNPLTYSITQKKCNVLQMLKILCNEIRASQIVRAARWIREGSLITSEAVHKLHITSANT